MTKYKTWVIDDLKIESKDEGFYLTGYANTKDHADSYGDIPTGDGIYDLTRMLKNPIMLANHNHDTSAVMGNFVSLKEDKRGLGFTVKLRNPESISQDWLKDTIQGYIDGFIKAISIGGEWFYGDDKNPHHLTKAIIHEISGVAVGADSEALTDKPLVKSDNEYSKTNLEDELKLELSEYIQGNTTDTKKIKELKNDIKRADS